jgi:hypothetical protein
VVTPAQIGELTIADQRDLRRWRESSAPAWLPKSQIDMGDDTAALIASAGIPPNKWRKVEITFLPDGTAKVTITPKHPYRYAETIILPDPSSVREMTRWLSSLNYPGLEVRIDNSPASPRGQLAA